MQTLFRNMTLALGLLFGLAAGAFAEATSNVHALESVRLTLPKQADLPSGKATPQGVKEHAAYLLLIRNALSLYRDGGLAQKEGQVVAKFINAHLGYTSGAVATATSDNWPERQRKFLRTLHYHALAARQLISLPRDHASFKGLMAAYQSGIGQSAYRAAEDLGVKQVWKEAP